MHDIATTRYVRLTTYTADGRPKHTPVWIAEAGPGRVGFVTDPGSWKIRRMRKTQSVELTPSDSRGRVLDDAESVRGSGSVVAESDPQYVDLEAALLRKYGVQYRLFRGVASLRGWFGRRRGAAEDQTAATCGVVIELDQSL